MKPKYAKHRVHCRSLNVVFWILSFLMYACGSGGGSGSQGGTGSISFDLELATPERTWFVAAQQINQAEFNCTANEIDTIDAQVMDQNDELIAEGGPFECTAGEGGVTNVPVGTNHLLVVSAKNSGDVTTFSGEVTISVREGVTTDVGTITLNVFNQPPVLDPIGNKIGTEGVLLSFTISAQDPNLGDVLKFEAGLEGSLGTLPEDAELVDNGDGTAVFNWTPSFDAAGSYNILFKVSDNGEGAKSDSESITITIADVPQPPPAPQILSTTKGTFDDRIRLTWSNVDNENEYRVFRADSSNGPFTQIDTTGTDVTSYDDTHDCSSSEFWYKVQAVNVAGSSGDSNIDSGFTMTCAPAVVTAAPLVNGAEISWREVSDADSYTVYWAPISGAARSHYKVIAEGITETSYTHTGLDTRRNYYVVTAVSSNGESPASAEVSAFPWLISTIDSDGLVGQYTSIDLDSKNYAHISYYDSSNGVKHTTNAGDSWSTEVVDPEGGGYTSIALDSNDIAHISYLVSSDGWFLYYATNETGSWVAAEADFGSQGSIRGNNTSIAIGTNGIVNISCAQGFGDFPFATHVFQSADVWDFFEVGTGEYASLALDGSNFSHMSFYHLDDGINELNYATNAIFGRWGIPRDVDTTGNVGPYSSIAINQQDNTVHISYLDVDNNFLKYATHELPINPDTIWDIVEVDDVGNTDLDSSIAIDTSEAVHISYHDGSTGVLKYATNFSGDWAEDIVDDASGSTGRYTSIAVDDNFNVHISYYDVENGDLKYATKAID